MTRSTRWKEHLHAWGGLPPDEVAGRHRLVLLVATLLWPITVLAAVSAGRAWVGALVVPGVAVALPAWIAFRLGNDRGRRIAASLALMGGAMALVYAWNGRTEAHFAFFVLLPLVVLYQDLVALATAAVAVLAHHAVIGVIAPSSVFESDAGRHGAPVTWALVHGAFVLALVGVLLVSWSFADGRRRELDRALSEVRAAQTQLLHTKKLESLGQLAGGIAHEINTPIQYIGDNLRFLDQAFGDICDMLERAGAAAADADEFEYLLREVPDAVTQTMLGIERVADIVRAMKGVAHPNADRAAGVDLNRLIEDTLTVTRNSWKNAATIDLQLAQDLPTIHAATGPLGQVVLSGLMNAVDAIVEQYGDAAAGEGLISVVTRRCGDVVELEITDNGCGMTPDVVSRAFDPFFTTKGVGRGTGQGLAVVRAVVVDQHGGAVDLRSDPGEGTSLRLTLPVDAVAVSSAASSGDDQVNSAYRANSQAVTSSGSPAAFAS